MGGLKIGDIVGRKSYGSDILFKVVDIKNNGKENIVALKGITYRIQADAPESDLEVESDDFVRDYNAKVNRSVEKKCREIKTRGTVSSPKKMYYRSTSDDESVKFSRSGRVLHLDGDSDYLQTCLDKYKEFGIEAYGKYIPEKDQASAIYRLLQEYNPNILVLTGHDGVIKGEDSYLKVDNYRNSKYFIEAVKEARRYEPNLDNLVIFAGACQSYYNGIISQGANFASAPERVLIHALDPVLVCQKIAFAGIDRVVEPVDVIGNTITGRKGIGGLQTRGQLRRGYPVEPYKK